MKILRLCLPVMLLNLLIGSAQAADSKTQNIVIDYPSQVAVGKSKLGQIFIDAQGKTLYALNRRIAFGRSGSDINYCRASCGQKWSPLSAEADAKPIGQWKVMNGVGGPQWAYKENLVFTFNDDAAGALGGDGYDDIFKAIVFVPPAPKLNAPANVKPLFIDSGYVLTDMQGHGLYLRKQHCEANCASAQPFLAGMANRDIGIWTVSRQGDQAQWLYRGQAVYVNANDTLGHVPADGVALQP